MIDRLGEPALPDAARWIVCGAGALYVLGVAAIRATTDPHPRALVVHPVAAAILVTVAATGSSLSGPAVLVCAGTVIAAELLYKAALYGPA